MALTVGDHLQDDGPLNFAQGEMAMFSTFLIFVLTVEHRWNIMALDPRRRRALLLAGAAIHRGTHPSAGEAQRARPGHLTLGLFFVLNGLAAKIWGTYNPAAPSRSRSPAS